MFTNGDSFQDGVREISSCQFLHSIKDRLGEGFATNVRHNHQINDLGDMELTEDADLRIVRGNQGLMIQSFLQEGLNYFETSKVYDPVALV